MELLMRKQIADINVCLRCFTIC